MIDYNELDRFYLGTAHRVVENMGGVGVTLAPEEIYSLFYKINDDFLVDVNNRVIAQIIHKDTTGGVVGFYIVHEETLKKVNDKKEILRNTNFRSRRKFDSSEFEDISSRVIMPIKELDFKKKPKI